MNTSSLNLSLGLAIFGFLFSTQIIFAADAASETKPGDQVLEKTAVQNKTESKTKSKAEIKAKSKAPSIEKLTALVDEGAFEEAYAMGQGMLFDFEGEPEFDLLYGTAAMEVGENKEAAFIFERLTAAEPSKLIYQLELGRVNYQQGEKEEAKAIFERVLVSEQALPEKVQAKVMAYLNAIAAGSNFGNPAKAESLKALIGMTAGYDSNANGSSDIDTAGRYLSSSFFGPGTVPFTNPGKETTGYLAQQIALAYTKPVSKRAALDFKVYGTNQNNRNEAATESGLAYFEAGNRWRFEKGLAYFALRATGVKLDHQDMIDSTQFISNWTQALEGTWADSLDLGLTLGAIRYKDDSKDINTGVLNAGLTKQKNKVIHALGIVYGEDDSQGEKKFTDSNGTIDTSDDIEYPDLPTDYYSRSYYGLNYSLSYLFNSKTVLHAGLVYTLSRYDAENRDFTNKIENVIGIDYDFAKQDGALSALVLGTRYTWNKNLLFKATATHSNVTSELDLYEFSRNKFEVGASYQF